MILFIYIEYELNTSQIPFTSETFLREKTRNLQIWRFSLFSVFLYIEERERERERERKRELWPPAFFLRLRQDFYKHATSLQFVVNLGQSAQLDDYNYARKPRESKTVWSSSFQENICWEVVLP